MIPVDDLEGLRVLVTGGSSGIGAATAETMARCGAHVAIHYRSGEEAAHALAERIVANGGKAVAIQADFATGGGPGRAVAAAAEALGGLDCLVNNAGAIGRTPAGEADPAVIDWVFDLNVKSVLAAVAAAKPHLAASDKASIVNVGSIAGRNGGGPDSGIYAAAKAAVHSLTRSMARELAPEGIRVNAVLPGVITTPFHDATPPDRLEAMRSTVAMGRLGTAQECAWAFVFLASPTMAGYITGQLIDINGGQLMP